MLTQQFWASVLWVRLIFVKRLSSRLLQNVLRLDCKSKQPKGEPFKMQMNCGKAWKSRYCFECSWSRLKDAPHDFCKMCRSRIAAEPKCAIVDDQWQSLLLWLSVLLILADCKSVVATLSKGWDEAFAKTAMVTPYDLKCSSSTLSPGWKGSIWLTSEQIFISWYKCMLLLTVS